MIDPRQSPVASLPILNAVAGHMIKAAAPLRVINLEDTQQMIEEAQDISGLRSDDMDLALHHCLPADSGESFAWETEWLTNRPRSSFHIQLRCFLDTLQGCVERSV